VDDTAQQAGIDADAALMLLFCQGDASAFDQLYDKHKGPLFRYLKRQCNNQSTAEELFQDVWLKVIGARERYQAKARFTTWLYHMAHNRLIDHYRQAGRLPSSFKQSRADLDEQCENLDVMEVADPQQVPIERQIDSQRQCQLLISLVKILPDAQREAFLLKQETGLSIQEIADITATGIETAKSRLRYAVATLRRGLRGEQ